MPREGVYVLGLENSRGECCYRFSLMESRKERLGEIQAYAARQSAKLVTELVDEVSDVVAGPDAERVVAWDLFVEERNSKFLSALNAAGVDPAALSLIATGLEYPSRRSEFVQRIESMPFSTVEKDEIFRALETATQAHRLQCSSRSQDDGALAHIPYVSHPIEVAMLATECGQRAPFIVAALLHDVLEDTEVGRNYLASRFSSEAMRLVDAATRKESESRSEFIDRISQLPADAKLLKCLDRFHNMIRAFSANSPEYPARNLVENEKVYNAEFDRNHSLARLKDDFKLLNAELAKFAS